MRRLIKTGGGELFVIRDNGETSSVLCPINTSDYHNCNDICAWYHECEYKGEATCYCQENEIGVRLVGEKQGEVIEGVIELAEAWVRRLSDYYDENHESCLDEGDVPIGEFIRGKLKP